MVVTIEGKIFVQVLSEILKSSGKTLLNFAIDSARELIDLQVFDIYTSETGIPCKVIDAADSVTDYSVNFSNVLKVLEEDSPVELDFSDTALTVRQKSFEGIFLREYEARQSYPDIRELTPIAFNVKKLQHLIASTLSIGSVLKELKVTENDPMFSNTKFYAIYSSICLMDVLDFPELCLPFSCLKDVVYKLTEDSVMYFIPEKNIVMFKTKKYRYWVSTSQYNMDAESIKAIEKKYSECKEIATMSLAKETDRLKTVSAAFPVQRAILSIHENGYSVSINTGSMNITIGPGKGLPLCSINTTTGTLATISKIFKDVGEITVMKGVNCLCLQQKNSTKNLLVFGMVW